MILLIGNTYFLGAHIANKLQKSNIPFALCGHYAQDAFPLLINTRPLYTITFSEIEAFLADHGDNLSTIINLSAMDIPEHSKPDLILQSIFRTNQKIWLWCAQKGVSLLYTSSALTYDGSNHYGFKDGLTSPSHLMPQSVLGWAHNLMDSWVHQMEIDTSMVCPPRTIAIKPFNLYGHYTQKPTASFIDEITDTIKGDRPIPLWTANSPDVIDGGYVRHFLHVEYCADAVVKILRSKHIQSNIINIADPHGITLKDAANVVGQALRKSIIFQRVPVHHKKPHLIERPQLHQMASFNLLPENRQSFAERIQSDLG